METNNRTQYCGVHCGVKNEDIITPILRTKRIKFTLLSSAFPTENLPKSTSTVKKTCLKKIHARNNRLRQRNLSKLCAQPVIGEVSSEQTDILMVNKSQTDILMVNKCTQVTEDIHFNDLPFKIDSDEKLNTMTGIPSRKLLDTMVDACLIIRPTEKANIGLSLKNRIVLIMYRIKTNFYKQHKPPNSKEKCMIENLFGITIT